MEAFSEEQEVFIPFLEEVPGSGHLWFAGILADADKVYLLFLHVVAQPDEVEVRGDVDQSVGHNWVPVLRQHVIYKELKPTSRMGNSGNKTALNFVGNNEASISQDLLLHLLGSVHYLDID